MILRIQRGDSEAFDLLFDKYKDEAVRTAYLITGKSSICEDIAQETFIKCYTHINELKNPNGFRAWFYKILTRTAWKHGRSASREIPTEDMAETASGWESVSDPYLSVDENRLLYSEINRLEPKQKTAIVLYYFNGLSTKEIAKASECLEGTVKSRLFSARKILKAKLDSSYNSGKERRSHAEYKTT